MYISNEYPLFVANANANANANAIANANARTTVIMTDFSHLDPDILDNTPAKCPVKGCALKLAPESLLAHLLKAHQPKDSMEESCAERYITYNFDLDELTPNCNHVLGVIAYTSNSEGCSGRIGMNHLPLMIMLYVSESLGNLDQFYVLYLVSLEPAKKLCAEVTMLFEPDGRFIDGQHRLRDFLKALPPNKELLHPNKDCLIYTESDIWKNLTITDRFLVQFELVLHSSASSMDIKKNSKKQKKKSEEETMWVPLDSSEDEED